MEYVDGETLAELVAREGPRPAAEVVGLGLQICRGLAAVHDAGLVHRDLKPQNLLLRRDGVLKLGDFGIAFGADATRLTTAGTVLGTAAYLAPEQARGEDVTAATDIYGAGAVLYELLSGQPPRTGTSIAELAAPPAIAPPPGVPSALAAVVLRCLAAEPRDRPSTAAALADELSAALDERTTLRLPAARPTRAGLGRPRFVLVAAALLAIAGGIAAAVATSTGGSAAPPTTVPVSVAPVQPGASAADEARNLASWLRRYSR
jgi:serine/threonine-protein kinase